MSDRGWRLDADALSGRGEALALQGVREPMSYRLLAGRATAVANALLACGVGEGERVGLLSLGRNHDEAVGLCGVLFAGAVAVPLDATSPPVRLAAILGDSGCRALVHDAAASALASHLDVVSVRIELDEDGLVLASMGDASLANVRPDPSLACVLHTSGSTGRPKAVPIRWEGLDAFSAWMIDVTELSGSDRVLRAAELIFDLAWFDHIATFRAGATLCTMSRRQMAAGKSTAAEIEQLRPTIIYGVPAMFMKLTAALGERVLHPGLRVICFAGEVFPPRELAALAQLAPGARLYNLFGPTETNVCTFHEVARAELDGERELPIGRACPYADCRLVNAEGDVIGGVGVGELVVSGPTAMNGEVATGDHVERRADGLFYFRGRMDRMLKIRGYRVEPSEVEAALLGHPDVKEAAVVAAEHPRLGKILRAVVSMRHDDTDARTLKKHLAERLAPYMVPEVIEVVSELPRMSTGKIDYQALALART